MPVLALRASVKSRVEQRLDRAALAYLNEPYLSAVNFAEPKGAAAFNGPESISWRIFKNPVSLFIGGVAAVLLEFAEPRVRDGVWRHSNFRTNPVARLKRTGLAAMISVYASRNDALNLINRVNKMHERIAGVTQSGISYRASDTELLNWVHATASFGFGEAYAHYVSPLTSKERSQFYQESSEAAAAYGAIGAPTSVAEMQLLFEQMSALFEPSEIIFEFRDIMRRTRAFPGVARYAQRPLVRAAIELLPSNVRDVLALDKSFGLRPFERAFVQQLGARAERLALISGPPAQACVRLGLPADYLYRRR